MKFLKLLKKIVLWIFCALFVLFAFAYYPNFSFVIFIQCAVLCAPLAKLQEIKEKVLPHPALRIAIVTALFLTGAVLSVRGNDKTTQAAGEAAEPAEITTAESNDPETAETILTITAPDPEPAADKPDAEISVPPENEAITPETEPPL